MKKTNRSSTVASPISQTLQTALTLHQSGQLSEAEALYRRILLIEPNHPDALHLSGVLAHQNGKVATSIELINKAILLAPARPSYYINLGNALHTQGNLDQAASSYRKAISLSSNFIEAHNNLGNVLQDQGKSEEAIVSYRKALALKPDFAEARYNLGRAHQDQGELAAAIECHRKAIQLKPGFIEPHSFLLFCLNYHPDIAAEDIYAEYRRWNEIHAQPLRRHESAHGNERAPQRRLRIAYVSPDLRKHPVHHFIEPVLMHHDKAAFEVFAYAEVANEDAISTRLRGYVDHWLNTTGMSDDALAAAIRRDKIDILIDLAGHTKGNRLLVFARKPAPIQVSWLGYGYTTGLDAMDYFLGDAEFTPPGCGNLFSEHLVRLPVSATYRASEGMGEPGPLPALQSGKITFGSLSRSVRINHRVVRTWAAILKRLPDSRLIINSGNFRSGGLQADMLAQFAAHGIAPERLLLGFDSPPWDVLRQIDISLDCFPHNSGTTLCESLYLGVPYITLASRPSVGRIGASALRGIGHPEWIATSEEDYVDKAVALAADLDRLAALRTSLCGQLRSSLWMDEPTFVRSVEAAYRAMWLRWCDGLPAADIDAKPTEP